MASLLSDVASTALTSLTSPALKEVASAWHFKSDLRRLENTMETIKGVLLAPYDDHDPQIPRGYKNLIQRLRDTVYEADDLLDEITTLAERKRRTISHDRFAKEVRTFFSGENQVATAFKISSQIKKIRKDLDDIVKDQQYASIVSWSQSVERPCAVMEKEDWSFVPPEDVIGREDEKREILKFLLRDDSNDPAVGVLAIVGFGGLGKTTVVQFAFNDEGVRSHFELKSWVCIGEKVGLKVIIRKIISATGGSYGDDDSLDKLQNEVRGKIGGKRYLLVLDDVWDDDPLDLSHLRSLLSAGDKGSRVLVTARSIDIAQRLKGNHLLELRGLSDDASWKLFAKMAFESEQQENDECRVQIGKEIIKKCANSPLAIKVVGSLLCGKDIVQWRYFKDRDLADIDTANRIMPLLKLSYYRLAPRLRRCFTYCSLFPKDYEINKIQLCYLWIAQGFITSTTQSQNESLEDVAEQCFMELLHRCFFQDIRSNKWGEIKSFKMHDLLHDLAQDVGRKEILLTDKDGAEITLDKSIRHLATTSFSAIGLPNSPSFLHGGGNHLRTYLVWRSFRASGALVDICKITCLFQRIKVLDLSRLDIERLPESIGKLIHLRYLDLSFNKLEMLPKSITKLYNLETLNLAGCWNLKALPWNLSKLVNLQNLDSNPRHPNPSLSYMPPRMGNLTHLRRLTQFVVGEGKSVKNASGFGDLKLLKNLGGFLGIKIDRKAITGNKSVKTVKVRDCLLHKSKLTKLRIVLKRENETGDEEGQDEDLLLESLQPHSNLKCFTLIGYYGLGFRWWMSMDNLGRVLPNLVEFELSGCERLKHLPILSQLTSLRSLRLMKLLSLEYVESKSYEAPTTSTPVAFFASLKTLELLELPNVKGWWPPPVSRIEPACDRQHDVAQSLIRPPSFPPLSRLSIWNCPNMTSMPLCSHVEDLYLLKFNERLSVFMETTEVCNSGAPSWSSPSSSSAPNLLSSDAPPPAALKKLKVDSIDYLYQLPKCRLPSLKELTIDGSQNVVLSGHFFQHLTELVDLTIWDCPELELLAADEEENDEFMPWKFLQRLRRLRLWELPKLETIPQGLNYLTNLQELEIRNCRNFLEVPDGIQGLTSLRRIDLLGCDGLKERCREATGEDWPKIQHIPTKWLPGIKSSEDNMDKDIVDLARFI